MRWPPLESDIGTVIWKSGRMPVPASALSYKKQREAQMAEAMLKGGAQTAQND